MRSYFFDGYGPGGSLWVTGREYSGTVSGQWIVFDQFCGNTMAACSYPVSGSGVLGNATTYVKK
jgi:hypothetical protein